MNNRIVSRSVTNYSFGSSLIILINTNPLYDHFTINGTQQSPLIEQINDDNDLIHTMPRILEKLDLIDDLENSDNLNPQEKLSLAQQRHSLTQFIYHYLCMKHFNDASTSEIAAQSNQTFFKKLAYSTLVFFGIIQVVLGTFSFCYPVLEFAMNLTSPAAAAISVGISVCNAVLFYSFELAILKEALGIHRKDNASKVLLETNIQQIRTVSDINAILFDATFLKKTTLIEHHILAKIGRKLNSHLAKEKNHLQPDVESRYAKTLRYVVTSVGVMISAGIGYYMGVSFVSFIAGGSLAGTPLGWAIIAGFALTTATYNIVLRSHSMRKLLNPLHEKLLEIKEDLTHFNVKTTAHFQELLSEKKKSDKQIAKDRSENVRDTHPHKNTKERMPLVRSLSAGYFSQRHNQNPVEQSLIETSSLNPFTR